MPKTALKSAVFLFEIFAQYFLIIGMEIFLYVFILTLVSLVFLVSMLGVIIPVLPSTISAFAAVLGFKLIYPDFYSWDFVIIAGIFAILTQFVDFFFTYYGAKRYGASWGGILGAIVGLIIGLIFLASIIMIFVAPIIGAIAGELLTGKDFKSALKAGWGTFVGSIICMIFKLAVVISIVGGFSYFLYLHHFA